MSRIARLWIIFYTAWRFNLFGLIRDNLKPGIRKTLLGLLSSTSPSQLARGERIRLALEALGPIFVKFGQVLSTRRDLLPDDVSNELAKLQDQVPPFSNEQSKSIIEAALGHPIDHIFSSFDATPVASASVAQVHFGILRGNDSHPEWANREVAIKVLRPGILPVIESDLALMHDLARIVEKISEDGRRLKPREVVAEFDTYLHDELDLMREAANASQLRRNFVDSDTLMIPEMIWDLCHTNVIVMERMYGVSIGKTHELRAAGVDFKKLAIDGVEIFFTQVFEYGFFHADMHPGNIQVSLAPETFGRYISLDFGIVGTLTEYDKEYLAQNFTAFFRRDYKRVAELHIESGWVPADTRVDELESAIRAVCEPYFDRPLKEISLGMVLMRLFQTSRRFQVEIQPQLVLLQKTLLNIEGLGRQLDPELDLWSSAKPFLEKWMLDQIGPQKLFDELKGQAPLYAKLLPQLPRLLHDYLQRPRQQDARQLEKLLAEQRRTNSLLQILLYLGMGFIMSLLAFQVWVYLPAL